MSNLNYTHGAGVALRELSQPTLSIFEIVDTNPSVQHITNKKTATYNLQICANIK